MYEIYINNGDRDLLFYRPGIGELMLNDIVYKPIAGSCGTLSFKVPATHPFRTEIKPMNTDFWLYKNKKKIFRGRYIGSEEDFYKTGTITCEGDLNFLVDSIQDPYDYTGGIQGFIEKIIAVHNARSEKRKQFKVGNIIVADSNNYINRKNSNYSTTADTLKNKLVDTHGGYFRTRYVGEDTYLDYVYDTGTCKQVVRFGENLIDIKKVVNPTSVITCLVPLGAEIENSEAEGAAKRVDISSVNNGNKYIVDSEGVKRWGYIWATHEWNDVTDPKNLLSKAKTFLASQIALPTTLTLNALDLSLIDADIDDFEVGQYVKVVSESHGLYSSDAGYILAEAEINISNPQNSQITLGGKIQSMTANYVKNQQEQIKKLSELEETTSEEIKSRVEATSKMITGGNGGYVRLHYADEENSQHQIVSKDHHPDEILIMNTDDARTAKNVIRMNQHGIGFSQNGYFSGNFTSAWDISGAFNANFITAGTMLADRVRGGTFVAGGIGNGQTGTIKVLGSDQKTEKVVMNENGITVYDGYIKGTDIVAGGSNNQDGTIKVYGADNSEKVVISKDGITVNSGTISGTTISGDTITGGTISGSAISGGTISGTTISGTTLNGDTINGGSISGASITVGGSSKQGSIVIQDGNNQPCISMDADNGISVTKGSISGISISGNTISGGTISGTEITGTTITGTTLSGDTITGGTISGTDISGEYTIGIPDVFEASDEDGGKFHFYGQALRVFADSSEGGTFSSVVNNSHRTWGPGWDKLYSYIGIGGDSSLPESQKGSSDSGIVYLSGSNADIYIDGHSVKEMFKQLGVWN